LLLTWLLFSVMARQP